MSKVIMVGCDLHLRSMVLRFCVDAGESIARTFQNTKFGREQMVNFLKAHAKKHNCERIVFVYEASSLGFGLCDMLFDHKISSSNG